jgi:antitoxin (DNA-binding transcriptional repressor) of toxin-antitoxin stability system
MAEWTGVRRLRDNLTDYVIRVAVGGDEVVVWSRGRAVARLRPVEVDDVWPRTARPNLIPITRFRHHISEFLRLATHTPLIVTWHDQPQVWIGPMIDGDGDAPGHPNFALAIQVGLSSSDEGSFGAAADH